MFCANCGKQVVPETNFCPACGTRLGNVHTGTNSEGEPTTANKEPPHGREPQGSWTGVQSPPPRNMFRPRSPRVLGGVCAAFALHFGWNLDLVRIVTAVLALFYGVGILAYLACWILIPEAPYALPERSR